MLPADAVAAALTACLAAEPDLLGPLGDARLRAVHVGFVAPRTMTLMADRAVATLDQARCPAIRELPDVADGALRCIPLPKGGFSCKPVPGPIEGAAAVERALAEKRPRLDACVTGKGAWTVAFPVQRDGAPGDLSLQAEGATDAAVVQCLVDEIAGWRFGPLYEPVPVRVRVGG